MEGPIPSPPKSVRSDNRRCRPDHGIQTRKWGRLLSEFLVVTFPINKRIQSPLDGGLANTKGRLTTKTLSVMSVEKILKETKDKPESEGENLRRIGARAMVDAGAFHNFVTKQKLENLGWYSRKNAII